MDYVKEPLRLQKHGPSGVQVYNISVKNGAIIVESGPMGRPAHRTMNPASEKPRIDRLVASLLEQGYTPFEKTFGPWSQVRHMDAQREIVKNVRESRQHVKQAWAATADPLKS